MTNLTLANGWIKEQAGSEVLTKIYETSAVEAVGRKVTMTSETMAVPRFDHEGASIVAEGGEIPVQEPDLDEVVLQAKKWADRFQISIEDDRDAIVDFLNQSKLSWANSFARKFDNACLGVTGNLSGVTVPYQSVYNLVGASAAVETDGDLTFEDLNTAFATLEDSQYNGDLVMIAHPSFKGLLRNLKDAAGERVVTEPLGGGETTVFGYTLRYSAGARTHATPSASPTGAPLLIVGNRQHLIVGVRDGVESAVSDHFGWDTDTRELKMRARRAFVPATAEAFYVIAKTEASA